MVFPLTTYYNTKLYYQLIAVIDWLRVHVIVPKIALFPVFKVFNKKKQLSLIVSRSWE